MPRIVEKASAALVKAGFRVAVVESKKPAVIGLIGRADKVIASSVLALGKFPNLGSHQI